MKLHSILKTLVLVRWCWLLLAAAAVLGACNNQAQRKMPNMYPPYLYRDKGPMGTNLAWRLLPGQFDGNISLASKKMDAWINTFAYMKGTVYISIGKNINLGDEALGQLLNYVDNGNEFFLSANNIDYRLLDTLGIRNGYDDAMPGGQEEQLYTQVKMADSLVFSNTKYGFFYYPFDRFFSSYDSSTTRPLGLNEQGKVNYIVTRYGKGKFYFHTEPAAFSNYFLLTAANTGYYSAVFSYLHKDASTVFWADTDRFGKKGDDFSALSVFWKNPPLKYALLLACTLMLFYIAFGSKRKRRLVPALPANTNDSLSFVQTIGNLYLQKKDNRNIAIKMLTYFFEHIRNSYHLNTSSINQEFVQALSRKSGVEEARVAALIEKVEYLNNTDAITDGELFEINNLIYEFYKR